MVVGDVDAPRVFVCVFSSFRGLGGERVKRFRYCSGWVVREAVVGQSGDLVV